MKSLVIIALVLVSFSAYAQQEKAKADTAQVEKPDSLKNKFLPTGIRFSTDVIALVKTQTQKDFHGWEVNADVDFYRYFLAIDYGSWGRDFLSDTASYHNQGNYWRIGTDVNFLLKDEERNMFFLGFRYGHSKFSENLFITNNDLIWGSLTKTYINHDVRSHWLELTTGLKVKIWKWLWMGYTGRLKFGLASKGDNAMLPHDVPGYGSTAKTMTWGFNYQIFIRIPFRKMPPLPPGKKPK